MDRSTSLKYLGAAPLENNINSYLFPQQISQHQERFIQMLNEPVGEGGEAPEVGEMGAAGEEGAPVNYIQVTPQEKEAIERVSDKCGVNTAGEESHSVVPASSPVWFFFFSVKSAGFPRGPGDPGLLRLREEREPGSQLSPQPGAGR